VGGHRLDNRQQDKGTNGITWLDPEATYSAFAVLRAIVSVPGPRDAQKLMVNRPRSCDEIDSAFTLRA
jgi:hypothetical protein